MEKIKKYIFIIFIIIFMSGCFDYTELNNITIISAIGIDYNKKSETYKVTLEILDTRKNNDSNKKATSKVITLEDKILSNCFNKAKLEMDKKPYYGHLNILLLDKNIISEKLSEINDFFLRNSDIRNNFYILGINNNSNSEDILRLNDNEEEIISDKIKYLLENNNFKGEFEEYIDRYIDEKESVYIPSISITNDNNLKIDGVYTLDKNISVIDNPDILKGYNILLNKKPNESISVNYNNNIFSVNIYNSNVKYIINKNNYTINIKVKAEIELSGNEFNYNDKNKYTEIKKLIESNIKNKVNNFIKEINNKNIDLLKINSKYYNKYGVKNKKYNQNQYNVNVEVILNKRGLIFEVNN